MSKWPKRYDLTKFQFGETIAYIGEGSRGRYVMHEDFERLLKYAMDIALGNPDYYYMSYEQIRQDILENLQKGEK